MMATTELDKIPETVLSRAQVYEFRTISTKAIAAQLRKIVDAEAVDVSDESLQLIARDAEGSMRDAQSKLDQVIAFTGHTIGADDVATVLGLVGRDLLFDAAQAVAEEDASAAFELAARAVEVGYDLRAVCRELSRLVRDLLVVSVDASRVNDSEIAGESERDRITTLAARFSREDLLRAFDLLTKAETEMRTAAQPRYHLEMALLRWIYLRKLTPIEDLIVGGNETGGRAAAPTSPPSRPAAPPRASDPSPRGPVVRRDASIGRDPSVARDPSVSRAATAPSVTPVPLDRSVKDAFLAEIRKQKIVFYQTVVAQAQKIEVDADRIRFTFSATQRTLREMFEQNRIWLESVAQQATGRRLSVTAAPTENGPVEPTEAPAGPKGVERKTALREQALADAGVQAMLEVFPAEIRDVEEM
jgi:DNA polymerase-3 subunit gamma/tau